MHYVFMHNFRYITLLKPMLAFFFFLNNYNGIFPSVPGFTGNHFHMPFSYVSDNKASQIINLGGFN